MAEVRIDKKDWVRVDQDGMTLRIANVDEAEALAHLCYETGDAGWIDVYAAIIEAIEGYTIEVDGETPRHLVLVADDHS